MALAIAAVVYGAIAALRGPAPLAAAADAFFIAFLVMSWGLVLRLTHENLKRSAAVDDEGIAVVLLIAVAVIAISAAGIFDALNRKDRSGMPAMALTLAGAPLGWFALHTIAAFHYANLYYKAGQKSGQKTGTPLDFPGTDKPGPWEFIYYSFVVGMTAQTSDVNVKSSSMRRFTTLHAVISYAFTTVLLAIAVNAAVAGAG